MLAQFQPMLMRAAEDVVAFLPTLAVALFILFGGWLLARLVGAAVRRLANGANRALDRLFRRGLLSETRISPAAAALIGQIAYWVVLVIAIAAAARVLGFAGVSSWLDALVTHLPNLLVGAAIIVVGYVVSVVVGEQVAATARAAYGGQGALVGRLAQSAIFVTTLVTGLAQIGVNVTFLIALFSVAVGAIFIGFSIAFGLGARDYVRDLIGAQAAMRYLKPGLVVQIGALQGEIIEITATSIVLDTARGKALAPAGRLSAETILILDAADEGSVDG